MDEKQQQVWDSSDASTLRLSHGQLGQEEKSATTDNLSNPFIDDAIDEKKALELENPFLSPPPSLQVPAPTHPKPLQHRDSDTLPASSAISSYSGGSGTGLVSGGQRDIFGNASAFRSKTEKLLQTAHRRNTRLTPPGWLSLIFRGIGYLFLACVVYFFLVGYPLWDGAVYNFWFAYKNDLTIKAGSVIFIGVAFLFAILPLTIQFEKHPEVTESWTQENAQKALDTAVIIACYKSGEVIGHTLQCALKTFRPENIFVIANGNSEAPLDNTADICERYGVRHIWVPIGSKICAQYVGVAAAYRFRYCLLIDDDVALPDPFPLVTERVQVGKPGDRYGRARVKCIGYTLEATDEEGGPGSLCQQAQNLEYKLAGLTRSFFGKLGCSSFPHGAVSLWERQYLERCFELHPGHRISEDWFFGLVSKELGGRIQFCSQVFVKTAVPRFLARGGSSSRAGYGELTVTSQRLWRWNYFLMARILYNAWYLVFSWRLRQYEVLTKLDMFQEMYSTLLLFLFPFIFACAVGNNPGYTIGLSVGVVVMYMLIVAVFCEVHLRIRKERVARKVVYLYYPLYKAYLTLVNIASTYTSLFNYVKYWTVRHPKVVEDEKLLKYMLATVGEEGGGHAAPAAGDEAV